MGLQLLTQLRNFIVFLSTHVSELLLKSGNCLVVRLSQVSNKQSVSLIFLLDSVVEFRNLRLMSLSDCFLLFPLPLDLGLQQIFLVDELIALQLVLFALGVVGSCEFSDFELEVVAGCLRLSDQGPVLGDVILKISLIDKLEVEGYEGVRDIFK